MNQNTVRAIIEGVGCYFHGADSGHNDYTCPSTDFNPPMTGEWCQCPSDTESDRMRFYVAPGAEGRMYHGWYCGVCRGIIQTG